MLEKPLSELIPQGHLYASDISPEFRQHLNQRISDQKLSNVQVVEATSKDAIVLPEEGPQSDFIDLAVMIDVYHHVEYPRTLCRRLRSLLSPNGKFVVIDFHRDPVKRHC